MTSRQLQQLDQRLSQWRASHSDAAQVRAAYRQQVLRFTLSSMHCWKNHPDDICITPEWICDIHRSIAGELFPAWAGRFRNADVQVGTHLPPPGHEVAIHIKNFRVIGTYHVFP